jgi:hypothetical protein
VGILGRPGQTGQRRHSPGFQIALEKRPFPLPKSESRKPKLETNFKFKCPNARNEKGEP